MSGDRKVDRYARRVLRSARNLDEMAADLARAREKHLRLCEAYSDAIRAAAGATKETAQ